ncbi:hypothetical protein Drorol1_Dr00019670 [Drosera rotundifolia]
MRGCFGDFVLVIWVGILWTMWWILRSEGSGFEVDSVPDLVEHIHRTTSRLLLHINGKRGRGKQVVAMGGEPTMGSGGLRQIAPPPRVYLLADPPWPIFGVENPCFAVAFVDWRAAQSLNGSDKVDFIMERWAALLVDFNIRDMGRLPFVISWCWLCFHLNKWAYESFGGPQCNYGGPW